MWEARIQAIPFGLWYEILAEGKELSFRELFEHLETDPAFAEGYTDLLSGASLPAFFWEHPPLTQQILGRSAEFSTTSNASPRRFAPVASHEVYPQLATFLRGAPVSQIEALWKAAAKAVRETIGADPRWLSTAGLGVAWLHLRLDTRPKYYRFRPYKAAGQQGRPRC